MARRCACDWLIEAMRHDPRLKFVPPAARWLWLALADHLMKLPEPGVFVVGCRIGSTKEIALLVSMAEPEVEIELQNLLETGLLIRRETDGALCLPALPELPRRSVQARENGGFGGRPRRGETAEQARERRRQQRELALMSVHSGTVSKTQETENKTRLETVPRARVGAAAAYLLPSEEEVSKPSKQQPRASEELGFLGFELIRLAGMDEPPSTYGFGPVKEWLAMGAAPDLIRDVIGRIAERDSYVPPRTLAYFAKAIYAEMGGGTAPAPVPKPADPVREAASAAFNRAFERWLANGKCGPAPVAPTFPERAA